MPAAVLRCYAVTAGASVSPLGDHGGFSGARLWRISGGLGEFCLRRWPACTQAGRLSEIHELMNRASAAGLSFVPQLQRTRAGASFVACDGCLWDVTSWQPGTADFHGRPTPERLVNAMTALADIHDAWRATTRIGCCPALERRAQRAGRWQALIASGWEPRYRKELHPVMNLWAERAWPIVRERMPNLLWRLRPWFDLELPLQPCLCDIWHDHVLFTGYAVTGIVDFGSVRMDHVTVDLARLLGSMAGDDESLRTAALAAYRRRRALSSDEVALMDVLDETGTLLGAANWLMWVYHDGRVFTDMEKAALRLAALVQRLSN